MLFSSVKSCLQILVLLCLHEWYLTQKSNYIQDAIMKTSLFKLLDFSFQSIHWRWVNDTMFRTSGESLSSQLIYSNSDKIFGKCFGFVACLSGLRTGVTWLRGITFLCIMHVFPCIRNNRDLFVQCCVQCWWLFSPISETISTTGSWVFFAVAQACITRSVIATVLCKENLNFKFWIKKFEHILIKFIFLW